MIKLVKLSASLRLSYEKSIEKDKIQLSKIVSILAAILFAFSEITDIWAISSDTYELSIYRWMIITLLITTFFLASKHPTFFLKHYSAFKTAVFLISGIFIEYTIYLSKPSDLSYYIYFSGLLIVFMVMFSWAHLKIKHLLAITAFIIGGYIIAIVFRVNNGPHSNIAILIPTLIILGASISVGMIGKIVRDNQLYERFKLQQSLSNLYLEKQAEAEKFAHDANHDALTGLPNRRFAEKCLEKQLAKAKKNNSLVVMLFIDLNGFKQINDSYGHDAGDHVLKVTAQRLRYCITEKDYLIRLGGDEFLISLVLESNEPSLMHSIINRIKSSITEPIMFDGMKLLTSASVGIAKSSKHGTKINELISAADKSMYKEKSLANKDKRKNKKHRRLFDQSLTKDGFLSLESSTPTTLY